MAPIFNKVCIVGVGLIGGSLGMAIKRRHLAGTVVGVVRRKETITKAFRKKALDVATLDLKEGLKDADLVILCAPVLVIVNHVKKIRPYLKKSAIVIDVGSSKMEIVNTAKKYFNRRIRGPVPTFVGCHPMAGSERSGVKHARADLFKNSICFVTSRRAKVENFWKSLGAKTVLINAKEHDQWVAKASHMPHLLAFTFFQNGLDARPYGVNPSLGSLARLSQSDPGIWSDIFLSNRKALLKEIESFYHWLNQFQKAIRVKNRDNLMVLLEQANRNADVENG